MTVHNNEISSKEIHGTQLRLMTDELELGTEMFEMRLEYMVQQAAALLGYVVLRKDLL